MKLALALLFGLLALASESLVSVVLAAIAGWLLGGQQELQHRVSRLERERAPDARAARPTATATATAQQSAPAATDRKSVV